MLPVHLGQRANHAALLTHGCVALSRCHGVVCLCLLALVMEAQACARTAAEASGLQLCVSLGP